MKRQKSYTEAGDEEAAAITTLLFIVVGIGAAIGAVDSDITILEGVFIIASIAAAVVGIVAVFAAVYFALAYIIGWWKVDGTDNITGWLDR